MSACSADADPATLKRRVGYKSVDDYVKSGMVVGLGTGSTAYFAVERLGEKLKSGELTDIVAVPTSEATKKQALGLDIPLSTLDVNGKLDVAIDGADEVDTNLNLTKGGGGALLREKMVEQASLRFICIVDESKLCRRLGPGFPLPVEITPFCFEHTIRSIKAIPALQTARTVLRMGSVSNNKADGDAVAITDNGNYIVDIHFSEPVSDVVELAYHLKATTGVLDHGLFVDMADTVVVGMKDGSVKTLDKGGKAWW
ncbi:unnamed protein product [Ectocarpus fasciculatus]